MLRERYSRRTCRQVRDKLERLPFVRLLHLLIRTSPSGAMKVAVYS